LRRSWRVSQSVRPDTPLRPPDQKVASGLFRIGFPPPLCQVGTAPPGPRWLHEIKLDGFRMAARIEAGRAQLLTRTGLDWSGKYPSVVARLANVRANSVYLDGELCGIDDAGLPSFSQTQAAIDGERGVRPVYYAFDLLHLDGRDTASLPLLDRKRLLTLPVATFAVAIRDGSFTSTPAVGGVVTPISETRTN
jgi:ATP-dependent DNA ligase